ncbi:MAG: hypothetical protein ACLP9C_00310 [Acidimicrobiales bacterium]
MAEPSYALAGCLEGATPDGVMGADGAVVLDEGIELALQASMLRAGLEASRCSFSVW